MTTPEVHLHPADAAELAELLQFLDGWLANDHDEFDTSLTQFIGHRAYGVAQLRHDLQRFSFLLGATTTGERLFGID